MLTYKQILEDDRVLSEYQKIDSANQYPFNHGLKHVKNDIEIMKKIIVALNINPNTANNLLIATALHDIGQVESREDHGKKGREFAAKYLADKISPNNLEEILNAIELHSQRSELDKLSLSTNLLCFADKMDFSRDRLEENYKERFGYIVYESVISVDFEFNEGEFNVKITTDKTISATDLLNEKVFFYKVIGAAEALANKLGVQNKIFVDNKLLNQETANNALESGRKSKQL